MIIVVAFITILHNCNRAPGLIIVGVVVVVAPRGEDLRHFSTDFATSQPTAVPVISCRTSSYN